MQIYTIQNYNNYTHYSNKMDLTTHPQNNYVTFGGGYNEMEMALQAAIDNARKPLTAAQNKYNALIESSNKGALLDKIIKLYEQVRALYYNKDFTEIDSIYKQVDKLYEEVTKIDGEIEQAKKDVESEELRFNKERANIENNAWSYI